ncbi:MAG: hypothetical protein EHM13_09735, partial [Acidobacteria bacterium]
MPGLGFLAPAFLLGALAAAIPIVLHLLRRRPDSVFAFSAVRLLRPAPRREARRRRLRNLLLLGLRVAVLLLLAEAAILLAGGRAAELDRLVGPRTCQEEAREAL